MGQGNSGICNPGGVVGTLQMRRPDWQVMLEPKQSKEDIHVRVEDPHGSSEPKRDEEEGSTPRTQGGDRGLTCTMTVRTAEEDVHVGRR